MKIRKLTKNYKVFFKHNIPEKNEECHYPTESISQASADYLIQRNWKPNTVTLCPLCNTTITCSYTNIEAIPEERG